MKKVLRFGAFLLACTALFAGGFQLNMQGNKAIGLGGAQVSLGLDPSSVFYNPGAITNLPGHRITLGGFVLFPKVAVQTPSYENIYQQSTYATPFHVYYSGSIYKNLWVGFGVNNPFGSSSSFDPDWQGKFVVQSIGLRTFQFQPTVAYRIHDRIGIGAGFTYVLGTFHYEKAVPVNSSSSSYGEAQLQGNGNGISFNAGILVQLLEKETPHGKWSSGLGISYRHSIPIKLSQGEARFINIPSSLTSQFPSSQDFQASITLPAVFTGGFHIRYEKEKVAYLITLDWQRNFWSSYDTLKFDFANSETPDVETPKNWKDVNTFRLGIGVDYLRRYSLRVGGYYDQTPIPDGYVSPELPDNTHIGYTFGIGIQISEKLSVDASYLYSYLERMNTRLESEGFEASYKRRVHVVGLGINYQF